MREDLAGKRRVIIVTGMHRSGTSALTKVLSLFGYDLPPRLLQFNAMDRRETNVTGFWESIDVRAINDRFFERLGLRWHSVAPMPKDAFISEAAAEARESIVSYLTANVKAGSSLLVKDPRISRMAPIWTEALAASEIAPKVVISLRNPIEVARSLNQRNGMRPKYAWILWLRHYLEAEAATRQLPRVIVSYENLMNDWRAACMVALRTLDPKTEAFSDDMTNAVTSFLRPTSLTDKELQDQSAPEWVEEVYQLLLACSEANALDTLRMDSIASKVLQADEALGVFYELSSAYRSEQRTDYLVTDRGRMMDELEGRRVRERGSHMVWFVMGGQRRYIPSPVVYNALFSGLDVIDRDDLARLPRGPDLSEGACLVQGDESVGIYLVTSALQTGACRHLVSDLATFEDFGFNGGSVRRVPELLIQGLPWGLELRRPPSRC